MDIDKIIEKYFASEFFEDNKSILDGIVSYIQTCTDEFIIKSNGLEIDEIIKKQEDPSHRLDNSIKIIENGIEVIYTFKEFWNKIKEHIPKSITKLTIPLYNIDFKELESFPNLETLVEYDYSFLSPEDIKYISENTSIKKLYVDFMPINKQNFGKYASTDSFMIFNDMEIYVKDKKNPVIDGELRIECSSLDFELIDKILDKIDMNDVKFISISTLNNNIYNIYKEDNNIKIQIRDGNLDIACDLYDYCTNKGYNVTSITPTIEYKKEIYSLNNYKTNYSDHDYTKLDELSKKTDLRISYDTAFLTTSSYDEFKGLVESVKWYKGIINDYPLSPLEKLAFAYDIMKTFNYNESKKDKFDSRKPHRIIETGNIVCVGYTALLEEIMEQMDPNIKLGEFSCSCYEDDDVKLRGFHSRAMVYINDDKYNVHGVYALDPTWDSVNEKGKEVLGDDYDALSLYHYFLIPFKDYETVFAHDSKPKFFKGKIEELNSDLSSSKINEKIEEIEKNETIEEKGGLPQEEDEKKLFDFTIGNILDDVVDVKDKIKSFDSRRLSFEEFLSLVRNVRMVEGYKGDFLENEMNKIERINSKYYGQETISEFVKQ